MAAKSETAANVAEIDSTARGMGTPEFIIHMAEDLKARSGSDLPLSCFVEQVRMQLAGRPQADNSNVASTGPSAERGAKRNAASSDCYRSWAMPE